MAKAKYNPINAFRGDPLAALKRATDPVPPATEVVEPSTSAFSVALEQEMKLASPNLSLEAKDPTTSSRASQKPLAATLNTSRNTVYLYPEDLTKLRQLSGYISSEHGIRANDSMLFRAALSLLEPDARLLHALKETELLDRRRKGRT